MTNYICSLLALFTFSNFYSYSKNLEIKSYYKNGVVFHESTFKDGFYLGKMVYYHSNGKMAEEKNYINGDLDGDYKEY